MDILNVDILIIVGSACLGYLSGSISSAILVCKALNLPDPRMEGSLNPGATNVLRIGGKKAAALTLLGDVLKGIIPLILIRLIFKGFETENESDEINRIIYAMGICGVGAVIGHMKPLFFNFKGGKGVATALGVLHTLDPILGLIFDTTWLVIALLSRISSLAGIVSWISVACISFWLAPAIAPYLTVICLLIIYRHKLNIVRLINGEESKISFSKAQKSKS